MTTPTVPLRPAVQPQPSIRLRPNVLAHPSPATGRFLLLIATLLCTGLLVGRQVHNWAFGVRWGDAVSACFAQANAAIPNQADVQDQIAHFQIVSACSAPVERVRALFDLAGVLAIAVLAVVVMLLIPGYIRRREKLREAGERLDGARQRIGELAADAGLARPPKLMLGRAGQRDAFVFGLPGRYSLVLPTALVVRFKNKAYFDPVVRHELAHLRRHDVPLAWLATAVWVAAVPVLLVPVIFAFASWDFSVVVNFLWRVVLAMGVIWLLRRQALRSREHDADLHAARQAGDWRPLAEVLQTATGPAKGSWWRRYISNHPTVAQRLAVLTDPGRIRGVSVVDGLAAGFLTTLLLPAIHGTLGTLLTSTPLYEHVHLIIALLVGPIAGLAIGVGLWRQAMIDNVTGERVWPGAAVLGFVGGLLLGSWADFNNLTNEKGSSYSVPVLILMGTSAVLLSAGTGRLWADAASRLPGGSRSWWLGFVLNALIFGAALWLLQYLPVLFTATQMLQFGFDTLLLGGVGQLTTVVYMPLAGLVVVAVTMVRRRRTLPLPGWVLEGGPTAWPLSAREPRLGPTLLGAVGAGAIAALGTLVYRLVVGTPIDDADRVSRFILWVLLGSGVAIAASFVTLVVIPRSGAAIGLVTGVPAALVAGFGTTAINTFAFGNILDLGFWWQTTSYIISLWFLGYLVMLPVSLVMWKASWRDVPGWLLATLSVIAGGVAALSVVSLAIGLR